MDRRIVECVECHLVHSVDERRQHELYGSSCPLCGMGGFVGYKPSNMRDENYCGRTILPHH